MALSVELSQLTSLPLARYRRTHDSTSCSVGYRRDPFLGRMRFHDGIDLSAPPGTVVHAAADGEVIHAGPRGLFGLTVVIDHRDGHRTLYGHMENLLVARGSLVRRGDGIGQVGSTGRATGPHLHFSVYYRGRTVDPTEVLPGVW